MVIDKIENLHKYIPSQYAEGVEKFLQIISENMEEKIYEIYGERVFAKVMSYSTKKCCDCKIEAHDKYIDIQATISGAEGIDIFVRDDLEQQLCCNQNEDVTFYHEGTCQPYACNKNVPGFFSMIFPEEAHRPQERVEGYDAFVKKFVIKVRVDKE